MKSVRFVLVLAVAVLSLSLSSCKHENIYSQPESLTATTSLIEFSISGGETTVGLSSNRDWASKIKYNGEATNWITMTPAMGAASYDANVIRISATPNDGNSRTADIVISTGNKVITIVVNQRGIDE